MTILLFGIWYLFGIVGSIILYRADCAQNEHFHIRYPTLTTPTEWCPSPIGILVLAVLASFGPILFAAGIFVCIIDWLENLPDHPLRWFSKPICNLWKK